MIGNLVSKAAMIGGVLVLALSTTAAFADKRVALVMGNSGYQNVARLPNPAADARSIAQLLRDAGFDSVDLQIDVGNLDFKRAIRKFEDTAKDADIAVVFYAGHGVELGGINYMIPVDARLASDRDAQDEAISLDRITDAVEPAKRLRLVILDACRDNPFVISMKRQRTATRGISTGLGKVEPPGTDTLIAYAAKAGSTADDGSGEHSPFTTALLRSLTVPGLDVRLAFGRVRDDVLRMTGQRQEPFVYGSLGGGNIALVAAPEQPTEVSTAGIKADYELVAQVGTRRAWEVFISSYKTGFYADLARAQLAKLGPEPAQQPLPPPNVSMASLGAQPQPPAAAQPPSSAEQDAWNAIRDSNDLGALQSFVRRYPNSPYAVVAQQRIDVLQRAAREREDVARIDRVAAQKRAEDERRAKAAETERIRADLLAAQKRVEEEQRAKAAEAERLKAELQAVQRREDEARRAEALAAQKRAEEERRTQSAEAAERARADAQAAQKRADEDRKAKTAEAERQRAELLAAQQRAEEERRAKASEADRLKAEIAAAQKLADEEKRAQAAEAERTRLAALAEQKQAACKREQEQLDALTVTNDPASALPEARLLQKALTCDALKSQVATLVTQLASAVSKNTATATQAEAATRDRILAAQKQLARIGCFPSTPNGQMNDATQTAITRYFAKKGRATTQTEVTDDLVAELSKQSSSVCPVECPEGKAVSGSVCVATAAPPPASAKKDDDDKPASQRQKNRREETASKPQQQKQPPRQQASSSGRFSGASIGVGF
jgi:hypothetical protein